MVPSSKISGVLLAAGESKRMGRCKVLLPFGGSTVIEKVSDTMLSSRLDEVIVVVGRDAEEATAKLRGRPVKIALNPAYREGMSTSIVRGLSLTDPQAKAVLFALADQPLIKSRIINQMISAFMLNNKGIALPVYQGRRGHPVIFSSAYRPELLELKGDVGAREVVAAHPEDVLEVPVDSAGVCADMDTEQEYRELNKST